MFVCNKEARGEAACTTQCDVCARRFSNGKEVSINEMKEAGAKLDQIGDGPHVSQSGDTPAKVEPSHPAGDMQDVRQGPTIEAQIIITLYSNGDFNVNGPLHDRMTMRGMLSLALDQEGVQFRLQQAQVQASQQMLRKEPMWKRKMRERIAKFRADKDEKKRKAAEAAAALLKNQ